LNNKETKEQRFDANCANWREFLTDRGDKFKKRLLTANYSNHANKASEANLQIRLTVLATTIWCGPGAGSKLAKSLRLRTLADLR
jgi:hypothetical protein